ncbi:MAG TPA: DNA polymerase III subunit gamma/tau, partial [Tepidisphaeraceae bacterium]|nr:DNA polymerase III subunit gamma/tau [Tepidisphaeraceae bacterium]
LAKALDCQSFDKPTTKPCGKCVSCLAIARGDDIDVIEIDAASNTGVDNVRDIISNAQYRPINSRFKIYIIDEVHMLSKSAFNALLKILEEPPEHVKFILATTEPEKVLPTILSRCQRYDFRNISTREIAGHLKEISKSEKIKADDDALLLIAKAGAGSMRDALSLLDRLLSVGEKQLTVEMIEQLLGMPKSQVIFDLVQHIGQAQTKQVLESAEKIIASGLSPDTLIAHLADHFRNLLILRTCGPKSNLVEVPGTSIEELVKQAERFDPVVLTQDITILEGLRRTLRFSQAGRALLDATLVRLALADQFTPVEELLNRANGAPTSASSVQKKKPEIAKDEGGRMKDEENAPVHPSSFIPHPSNIEPVDPNDLTAVWNRLLSTLAAQGPSLPPLLAKATFTGIEDGKAILSYPRDQETVVRILDRNGKKETICTVLSELLHQNVGVKFQLTDVIEEPSPVREPRRVAVRHSSPPPAPETAIRITEELRSELRSDPLINAIMKNLGGEIVKVE